MSGLTCPTCGANTSVLESRHQPPHAIRRRRLCSNAECQARWVSIETIVAPSMNLLQGRLETGPQPDDENDG